MTTATRSRRGVSRHEEEQEEETPRRSRRPQSREDDYEDERPTSRRGSRRDVDDEAESEPRGSRRGRPRSDDEDESSSRSSRRRPRSEEREESDRRSMSRPTRKGWDSYRKAREEQASDFTKNFTIPEEETIIKVLDEEPFVVFDEHWIDELKGKKSWVCIGKDDCPLCAVGEKPRLYAYFNILDFTNPEKPVLKPWKCSTASVDRIEKLGKKIPVSDPDVYLSIYKTGGGKKGRVDVHIDKVDIDELEDWDVEPLSDDELDEFYDNLIVEDDVVEYSPKSKLREIAGSLD